MGSSGSEPPEPTAIPWTVMKERPYIMLYAAQVVQLPKFGTCVLACGGGGVNECKVFRLEERTVMSGCKFATLWSLSVPTLAHRTVHRRGGQRGGHRVHLRGEQER